jgi:hypothetical protein
MILCSASTSTHNLSRAILHPPINLDTTVLGTDLMDFAEPPENNRDRRATFPLPITAGVEVGAQAKPHGEVTQDEDRDE